MTDSDDIVLTDVNLPYLSTTALRARIILQYTVNGGSGGSGRRGQPVGAGTRGENLMKEMKMKEIPNQKTEAGCERGRASDGKREGERAPARKKRAG